MKNLSSRNWVLNLAVPAAALALVVASCSQQSESPVAPSGVRGGTNQFTPNPDPTPTPTPEATPTPTPTPPLTGRFTGGGFQINFNDVKVTRGFTLHCDEILSNNFEVNWKDANGDAHHFHIEKNPDVTECSLVGNPPNPPNAGVNRIVILNAPGALDGVTGHTVTIVLEDHGEPGTADRAYIAIDGTALTFGSVAVPALIDGGNIQAHFDQPHKN